MAYPTVTVQPGILISPDAKTSQWSSGLCDCCEDMGVCCCGFWCPCCLMCKTSEEFGECLCLPLVELFFVGIVPPVTYSVRTSMRERYRIQGTMCDDCCVVTCCGICAWCQMARELKYRRQPQVIVNPPLNPSFQQVQQSSPSYNQQFQPPINKQFQPQPMGYYPPTAQ